ncbi:MAG: hypothetical protein Q4E47_02020 [Candidatus Saccharibacteria bacterium]|nr:hypothetical protein [Candidatus Saccharibacteria bacterium]
MAKAEEAKKTPDTKTKKECVIFKVAYDKEAGSIKIGALALPFWLVVFGLGVLSVLAFQAIFCH